MLQRHMTVQSVAKLEADVAHSAASDNLHTPELIPCLIIDLLATATDKHRAHTAKHMHLQQFAMNAIMTHLTHLTLTAQAQVCSLLQLLKYLRACWYQLTQTLIVQEALCEVLSLAMYLYFSATVGNQAESQLHTYTNCIGSANATSR